MDATGSPTNLSFALRAGDTNNANTCDVVDFGVLINAYGSSAAAVGSDCDLNADFNCDGAVAVLNFGLRVNNYGAEGDNQAFRSE